MKRGHIITLSTTLGLATLLTVVLLVTLVGPASASTGKTVNFEATRDILPAMKDGATPSLVDSNHWIYAREYKGPDGVHSTGGWLWEGRDFLSADRRVIPFLTGYSRVAEDCVDKTDDAGQRVWAYEFDSGTLYVGCDSMDDVTSTTPIWRWYAFGMSGPDGIMNWVGVNYGIAGAVRGWEAHWTEKADLSGLKAPEISGYYVTR